MWNHDIGVMGQTVRGGDERSWGSGHNCRHALNYKKRRQDYKSSHFTSYGHFVYVKGMVIIFFTLEQGTKLFKG